MRRMASNSNIKMGKARVFWMDGLVDAFFFAFLVKFPRVPDEFSVPQKGA